MGREVARGFQIEGRHAVANEEIISPMQAGNNEDTEITRGQKLSVSVTGPGTEHKLYTRTKGEVDSAGWLGERPCH